MKDFLGVDIEVGDTVIACVSHGKNSGATLVMFDVTRLTDKMVVGNIPKYHGCYVREDAKISPEKCFVHTKKSLDN